MKKVEKYMIELLFPKVVHKRQKYRITGIQNRRA